MRSSRILLFGTCAFVAVACSVFPPDPGGNPDSGGDASTGGDGSGDEVTTVDGGGGADGASADSGGGDGSTTGDASSAGDGGDGGGGADAGTDSGGADAGPPTGIPLVSLCTNPPAPRAPCKIVGQLDCAGTCINAVSDANNCGACGNVCAGGEICAAGACVDPATLVVPLGRPEAYDLSNVYYHAADGLWQIDKNTFVPTQLSASTTIGATKEWSVAVDAQYVYWVDGATKIYRTPIGGGASELIATSTAIRALNLGVEQLYWVSEYTPAWAEKVPGGAAGASAGKLTWTQGEPIIDAVQDERVYYRYWGTLHQRISSFDRRIGITNGLIQANSHGFAGAVAPGTGAPIRIITGHSAFGHWSISDPNVGGTAISLASGDATGRQGAWNYPLLASDGCTRYYSVNRQIIRLGTKLPSEAFVVAKAANEVTWLGADDQWLYWEEKGSAQIRRVAKWTQP